ncbi:hypothetical protein AcW1_001798 [Taiwanofungus camphoratus]|nr:hypothetical protein AcV5_000152 [Antrodia cinnamomea]KAI0945622.1 hypothetical protein AcW1_001798 [Antrodia cinnamomea]
MLEHVPKWVPGAGWKDKARVWREAFAAMRDIPYNLVKEQMRAGTALPNFTSINLEVADNPDHEDVVKWAAASLYLGISLSQN